MHSFNAHHMVITIRWFIVLVWLLPNLLFLAGYWVELEADDTYGGRELVLSCIVEGRGDKKGVSSNTIPRPSAIRARTAHHAFWH